MTPPDIPASLLLCRRAGWNQTRKEWELFLQLNAEGCRVATDERGKVVGTVTTVRYQDHFGWIGMVLVDPDRRRQGIGLQLLREALRLLPGETTVKLDATPSGREVYRKLGFTDEYPLRRMQRNPGAAISPRPLEAQPMAESDLLELIGCDRDIFGADRQLLLEWMLREGPQYAFVTRKPRQLTGYCFGRTGHRFAQIGPVVAQNQDDALALVSAALRGAPGLPAILDVSSHDPAWVAGLTALGFIEQRPLIRMFRGSNSWPGTPEKQFAILGPEFG